MASTGEQTGDHDPHVREKLPAVVDPIAPRDSLIHRPTVESVAAKVQRIVVILNPFSGNGRGNRAWSKVQPVFEAANIHITLRTTESQKHAVTIARELGADAGDALVVIGGDGTLSEVLAGMMTAPHKIDIPVGLIPGGTGNSVACSLGIKDPEVAARAIVGGRHCPIDIGKIICTSNGTKREHFMINLCGFGLGVDANVTAANLRLFGKMRYDVGAFWQILKGRRRNMTISIDGDNVEGDILIVMIQNNKHGGVGLRLAPAAIMDDGLLDIVVLPNIGRAGTLSLFSRLKDNGKHVSDKAVVYRRFRKVTLKPDQPQRYNLDGENFDEYTEMEIEVVPRAINMFVATEPHLC
ncbi:unnamed protein product (mitochondrion) [Plasmodiophora brassicae]|uniref:DAGKc domain-containing protein n=1 Tax=Plasmodiophora brassicae TaxID=37360 RepID=A0A0G4IZA1_PLABS|nr:hypothetical protein PBRA_001712 [Plasmodiophora brassicae]SPQ93855.1 unnamed protein product [Plasmodiophora brassicae]